MESIEPFYKPIEEPVIVGRRHNPERYQRGTYFFWKTESGRQQEDNLKRIILGLRLMGVHPLQITDLPQPYLPYETCLDDRKKQKLMEEIARPIAIVMGNEDNTFNLQTGFIAAKVNPKELADILSEFSNDNKDIIYL